MTSWSSKRSLRFRLALWYAVGGTVLIAGFAGIIYYYVSSRIARPLEEGLRGDVAAVTAQVGRASGGALLWAGQPIATAGLRHTEYPWFELWDENGALLARVWPFNEAELERVPTAPTPGRETISIFNVDPDIRLRVFSVPFTAPGHTAPGMLRVMRIHESLAGAVVVVRWIIVIALPLIIILLVLGGYFISQRWLAQFNRVVSEADRITAENLAVRLPIENPNDELGRLTSAFNVTLDRLEASFVTLDRFVGDASHELRTPLTTLRSVGEIGLRKDRSPAEYREIIGSMLEEAQRLDTLIARLLELATAEGRSKGLSPAHVRLDEYVHECVADLAILGESKGQHIEIDSAPCTITTDPVLLRRALENLVENAIKYSPADSTIRILVRPDGPRATISVIDQGPGIAEADRTRLTERFFRTDRSRGRETGGFGLGLSITKAYMRALGGTLEHENVAPHGSNFRLILPGV